MAQNAKQIGEKVVTGGPYATSVLYMRELLVDYSMVHGKIDRSPRQQIKEAV
jgi:hypothetical protein